MNGSTIGAMTVRMHRTTRGTPEVSEKWIALRDTLLLLWRNPLRDDCVCVLLGAKQQHPKKQEDGGAQPSAYTSKFWCHE